MLRRKSWDDYYLDIVQKVAERSSCLSEKIGAILVRDKIVICEGYNGPARKTPHCGEERMKFDYILKHRMNDAHEPVFGTVDSCPRKRLGFPSGQGLELCPAVHAEANCIANAARLGIKTKDSTMYLTCGVPCKDCFSLLINAGVTEVVVTSLTHYDALTPYIERVAAPYINVRVYERYEMEEG